MNKKIKKEILNEEKAEDFDVFDKYHNLSIKELKILLEQKNDILMNLNTQKEKYKKILNDTIKKLNSVVIKNSDVLYEEDYIANLENIKEEKKRELQNSKKINKLYKLQFKTIKDKISENENENNTKNYIENKINNLKMKNNSIKKEINNIKVEKIKHKKKYEIIIDNNKFKLKYKIKTDDNNNTLSKKYDYLTKFNMSMKSLDNIIKEVKRFEEIYISSNNKDIDENLYKKINYWINIIKTDLTGDKNEILSKIENDKSIFLTKVNNMNLHNKNELKEKFNTEPNDNNNKIKIEINDDKIAINKNLGLNRGSNSVKKDRENIRNEYKNLYENSEHKSLYKKINYLKIKTPLNSNKKIFLTNSENYNRANTFVAEKMSNNSEENNNNIKISRNISIDNNELLENILSKDYNQISNEDYRELLSKKDQYIKQNLRLENNIDEIKKTKTQKFLKVLRIIEENNFNLQNLKKRNDLIKSELDNLTNIKNLKKEKISLENKINYKKSNLKKSEINEEQKKSEIINNNTNNGIVNQNNQNDILDDINKTDKKIKKNKSNSKKKKYKSKNNEVKLETIKEEDKDKININDNKE
jgi:hypothetical protein